LDELEVRNRGFEGSSLGGAAGLTKPGENEIIEIG
jgi:hypothetical protein